MLGGGEFPIPRDFDLDVLAAVSVAGNAGVGATRNTGFFGGAGQNLPPTELIILRNIAGDNQIAIRVDLNNTINDRRTRILVKAGDTLILRFKPQEEIINFVTNVFFTFGIQNLFR